MDKIYLLDGGIGDFLQCIPFINAGKHNNVKYGVITHLLNASKFFEAIGVKPEFIYKFSNLAEKQEIIDLLPFTGTYLPCPRSKYFDRPAFEPESLLFNDRKPVIGVHINGSSFSLNTQKQFGIILKNIPTQLISELLSEKYNLMVFGLKQEIMSLDLCESKNLKFVTYEDPAKSLAFVAQCSAFVGSDSGFKTMSSMSRIPTLVWLGDYVDKPRDEMFISPYLRDGIIELFKYKNLDIDFAEGLKKTKDFLSRVLRKNPNYIFESDYGPMILNANDKGICSDIRSDGYFEKDQILLIRDIIEIMLVKKTKINFYDVGANIGTHTLAVAKKFQDSVTVRAFEAQRQIYYMLCGTVAINGLRNVHCHNLAIGGYSGSLDVRLPEYSEHQNFGGFELMSIDKSDNEDMKKNDIESIKVVTLDHFKEEVNFLKMDIEGMEESALIGSINLLNKFKPVCFIEIFKSNEDNIFKIFKKLGYIGFKTNQDLFAFPPDMRITLPSLPQCF